MFYDKSLTNKQTKTSLIGTQIIKYVLLTSDVYLNINKEINFRLSIIPYLYLISLAGRGRYYRSLELQQLVSKLGPFTHET